MTIEQRPNDPSTEHAREGFVLRSWLPLSYNFVALDEAADVEPYLICRPATKTSHVGSKRLLNTFLSHDKEFRISDFGLWN
jgi:hypothetical protein